MKVGLVGLTPDYLIQYSLSEEETKIFISILLREDNSPHTSFILVLLKELDYDMAKFLRVINVGYKTKGLIQRSMLNKVISVIKEAVIIKDIEFRGKLDQITISELSRSQRYKDMGISRSLIYKTIYKHELDVLESKRG